MMKKTIISLVGAGVLLCAGQQTVKMDGKTLFSQKCSMCHISTRPSFEMRKKLIAPPIMGVLFHIKKHGMNEAKAVAFIKDYVISPSRNKALCESDSIKRFGLMPSQKGNVTSKELEKIAHYLYKNFPPKGFKHQGNMGRGKQRP